MKLCNFNYVRDASAVMTRLHQTLRSIVALIVIRVTVAAIFTTVINCFCTFAYVAAFCITFTEMRACKSNFAASTQACASGETSTTDKV